MLKVEGKNGSLLIPAFGSGLKLVYKNKYNGKQEIAKISPGPKENHFYAYFKKDDVDFEIEMDNSSCKDRSVCFDVEILNEEHGFLVRPKETWKIETLESNGKKLHFIRQSGEEGKSLVSSTASSHGICRQDASTLLSQIKFQVHYEVRKFFICVKNEQGGIFKAEYDESTSLYVNSQTTIAQLRSKISPAIKKHPEVNYTMILNGKQLKDYDSESTLDELKINEDCQLICTKKEFPVQVKMKGWRTSPTFQVSSWTLVQDLKEKIEEKEGVPIAQQKLLFNEKELYFNVAALGWSGIIPDSVLELQVLEIFPLKIKMIPSNKIITIPVFSRNTISQVMDKAEEQEGISIQEQTFFLYGSPLPKTDELLENVGIKDADVTTIFLYKNDGLKSTKIEKKNPHECKTEACFPITVQNGIDDTILNLNVCSSKLVGEVKEKIQEQLGISTSDQKLQFRHSSRELSLVLKDDLPLEFYDIEENSNLTLTLRSKEEIPIFLISLKGNTGEISFLPSDTTFDLMLRIEKQEGIPAGQQRLIFAGKQLEGDQTLLSYNIQEGATLHIVLRLRGGGCGCGCQKPSCSTCALYRAQDFSERGAITFGEESNQTFSSCSFEADESIKIEPFIIELRLAGVSLLP